MTVSPFPRSEVLATALTAFRPCRRARSSVARRANPSAPRFGAVTAFRSSLSVFREHVISCLHDRVTREPTLGVVALRRLGVLAGRRERVGRGVVEERTPSPSAAVREPLAVLHHEVDVVQASRHGRIGERLLLFGFQWIFAILEPSGKGLPLPGIPDW